MSIEAVTEVDIWNKLQIQFQLQIQIRSWLIDIF